MTATAAVCENCDEPIHLDGAGTWIHDETNDVPCVNVDVPVAEPRPVECKAERHSWDFFNPNTYDSFWLRCDLTYPHDEHENSGTGVKWFDLPVEQPQSSEPKP